MTERHCPDPAERYELDAQDQALAGLLARYIERREHHVTPHIDDLLAAAGRHSVDAPDTLRAVIRLYEALRADDAA